MLLRHILTKARELRGPFDFLGRQDAVLTRGVPALQIVSLAESDHK